MNTESKSENSWIGFLLAKSGVFLIPFFFLLLACLPPYLWKTIKEVIHIYQEFPKLTESELMISILTICDISMIANLIVMIAIGSYQIFVKRLVLSPESRPQWIEHISSGLLKIKMSTSLVGISSIHLLKDFINADNTTWDLTMRHILLHVVFLISTCALVFADRWNKEEKH
jgi:uncharacterized protein (TIGR00645 family)